MRIEHIILVIVTFLVPTLAYYKKALTVYAALLAMVMALVAISANDNYALFLLTEFLLITVIDKTCKKKLHYSEINYTQKAGTRDAIQVFVNGGVALFSILIWHISKQQVFLWCFVASLIEGFADSVASSVGIAIGQQAYDICRFRKINPGLSGGISIAGTIASIISCVAMAAFACLLGIVTNSGVASFVALAAFGGCVVDSILGSVMQRKEKCAVCGIITEKKIHCDKPTEYYSGCKWMNNDMVNLISSAVSAILAFLLLGGH